MPRHLLLLLSLALVSTLHAQSPSTPSSSCTYDYECKNIPYAYCKAANPCFYTINGFGVSNGSIYYSQQCQVGTTAYYIFKKIPVEGGTAVDFYSRVQIPADVNPTRIIGVRGNYLYFYIQSRAPGLAIKSVDLTNASASEGVVNTGSWTLSINDFDSSSTATYLCNANPTLSNNKTIERYPALPSSGTIYSQAVIYTFTSLNSCGLIRRYSDTDLFFTSAVQNLTDGTITTYFYHGSTICSSCALPTPFFSTKGTVFALDASGDFVFYGMDTGLYRVRLDGSSNTRIVAGVASAIAIIGGNIKYNSGSSIKSVDFEGNNAALLSNAAASRCACRSGFEGALCDKCTGQVQWQPATNLPVCIPLLNGVPTSCYEDYQCGNVPFTVCRGTCQCANTNFTGSRCDQCNPPMQASWKDGYPVCA